MTHKPRSIVLLSGGLDSALSFVVAKRESNLKYALTFNYGQKSAFKEIRAAYNICQHYGVLHKTIELPFFKDITDHPFFSSEKNCPEPEMKELDNPKTTSKTAKAVWVPNRNGIFLNVAAGLAEIKGISQIYVGFNAEEAATFPDNTADYVKAANKALTYSTLNQVTVQAPTVKLNKDKILKTLIADDFPIKHLWSCYTDQDKMCGKCESCKRLKRAFDANSIDLKTTDFFFSDPMSL